MSVHSVVLNPASSFTRILLTTDNPTIDILYVCSNLIKLTAKSPLSGIIVRCHAVDLKKTPVPTCLYESALFCPHCRKPVLFPEVITTIVHGVATPCACISCRRIMTVRFYSTRYMIFTGTFVNHSSVITPAIFNA